MLQRIINAFKLNKPIKDFEIVQNRLQEIKSFKIQSGVTDGEDVINNLQDRDYWLETD